MLASIIYNYGKFCDDFKSTLKLGAYERTKEKARRNIELLNQELQGLTQSVLGETGQKDCLTKIVDCMKANDSLAAKFQEDTRIPYVCISWEKLLYGCGVYKGMCLF